MLGWGQGFTPEYTPPGRCERDQKGAFHNTKRGDSVCLCAKVCPC